MDYFKKNINLIKTTRDDEIIGPIERWNAHQQAILHRGFTVIIKIGESIVIQKRKHKVFNNVFDLSFSSHPIYNNKNIEKIEDSIKKNFKTLTIVILMKFK
ncbi:MAG: hypothetical protein ACK4FL_01880 [Microgenomates group bacterium]